MATLLAVTLVPQMALAADPTPEPSLWSGAVGWMMVQQRAFHQELIDALKALTAHGGVAAAWSLVAGSFLYGIFHAAGPGHGKAVLTTYLLTHPHRLSRGMGIAAAAAICQGIMAIILVYGLIYLAGWIPRETSSAVAWSERLSYILVAALGALLLWRTLRGLTARYLSARTAAGSHAHDHGHHHDHGHDHDDDHCDSCGHAHMPSGEQLENANTLRSALGLVLAIGLRPCTGAVLVLVLAKALNLPVAGVAAVMAMSVGTGMAVASLAFLAVKARHKAVALTADRGPFWRIAGNGVALAGGGLLLILGLSMLSASFYTRHPLGF